MPPINRSPRTPPDNDLAAQYLSGARTHLVNASSRQDGAMSKPALPDTTLPSRLRIVTLEGIESEAVDWLWSGYVPLGKLTVLEGDPGLGKSLITVALAAAATTGDYSRLQAAHNRPPADVFFVTYEDGVRDTIVPRLRAAGADLSRTHVIQGVTDDTGEEDLFTFPDDVPDLQLAAQARRPCLVVVDPLSAALSSRVDSYKDQDVRRALARIARFAEATGAAVLVVRHLNKGYGRSAILTGGGSIGIAGAARSVLVVGPGEGEKRQCVLAVVKCNLAARAPSLAYTIEPRTGGHPVVEWHGVTSVTADDLSAARADGAFEADAASERDVAKACLREWLGGGAVPKQEIAKLARNQSVAERTLQRAAKSLGVEYERHGKGRDHMVLWVLPGGGPARAHDGAEDSRSTRANTPPHHVGASQRGASSGVMLSDGVALTSTALERAHDATRATPPYIREVGASHAGEDATWPSGAADLALDAALDGEAARARQRGRVCYDGER
jgi:hypothetical protein